MSPKHRRHNSGGVGQCPDQSPAEGALLRVDRLGRAWPQTARCAGLAPRRGRAPSIRRNISKWFWLVEISNITRACGADRAVSNSVGTSVLAWPKFAAPPAAVGLGTCNLVHARRLHPACLLYTSDAADEED